MDAPTSLTSSTPATITPAPTYQPELYPPTLLFGARPLSLDAHVFYKSIPYNEPNRDQGGWRMFIDCHANNVSSDARSAEDDDGDEQCRRANLFPAEVYHDLPTGFKAGVRQNQTWGGTYSPSAAPEKTWRCELSTGGLAYLATATDGRVGGDCSMWEAATGSGPASTTTGTLDQCGFLRSRVPVRLTGAGEEGDWEDYDFTKRDAYYPMHPVILNSWLVEHMSSLDCPDPTSLLGFGVAAATATASGASGAGTGSASAGAESRGERAGSAALICVALAGASVVAGLLSMPLY